MSTWKTGKTGRGPAFLQDHMAYPAALHEAHNRGLLGIETDLLQVPNETNDHVAIVHARVMMPEGRHFEGIGDASPENVGANIAPHIIRMAETRAKGRALRDAIDKGRDIELEDEAPPDIRPGWNSATNSPPKQSAPLRSVPQTETFTTPADPRDNVVQIRSTKEAVEFVERYKPRSPGDSGGGATEDELEGLKALIEVYQDAGGQEPSIAAWEQRNLPENKTINNLSSEEVRQYEFILENMIEYVGGKAGE